jgi:hypothetical protein
MPRGFKKNERATREALATGFLQDKGSFISQPKAIKGECEGPKPHLVLKRGSADMAVVRAEIFRRNRAKYKGGCRCEGCGDEVFEHLEDSEVGKWGMQRGEWHHIRNKAGERCDDPENGEVICHRCHSERHPRPQFGKSKIVSQTI